MEIVKFTKCHFVLKQQATKIFLELINEKTIYLPPATYKASFQ